MRWAGSGRVRSRAGQRAALIAAVVLVFGLTAQTALAAVVVTAVVETAPAHTSIDAADDTAIWVHPTDPSLSTVIGTDNKGYGLAVYDLAGRELQYDSAVQPNNVDLRYNFPLGGAQVPLIAFSDYSDGSIGVYTVDGHSRRVVDVSAGPINPLANPPTIPSGFCLYRSAATGKHFGYLVNKTAVHQWELFDNGSGKVDGKLVRTLPLNTNEAEGCVADDATGRLYVAEEDVGIWSYGAEPADGTDREQIDTTGPGGNLVADVEGLAIYPTSTGGGYLLASSQGGDRFEVYGRLTNNTHLGSFSIGAGATDEVTRSDGIEVTNFPLGPAFPSGLFTAQDDSNPGAGQNFKYVHWNAIAEAFEPDLTVDTTYDPRTAGGSPPGNRPPFADAGPDQPVLFPATTATLSGRVTDDGLPGAAVTSSWAQVEGPAGVAFANPASPTTSATFPGMGTYVLKLTASDGAMQHADTVTVHVAEVTTVQRRITASSDDAEERADGVMDVPGADLELGEDATSQTVGLRFSDVAIPPEATITRAYVQFKVDEVSTGPANLAIAGEAAVAALPYTKTNNNISSRPRTAAVVAWSPPDWPAFGHMNPAQQTPNLASILQEIVGQAGWVSGNPIALVVTGTGRRTAESFEGDATNAPLLHVEYRLPQASPSPTPSPSPSASPSPTPSPTPTPTISPSPTPGPSPTTTASPTPSPTPTGTISPSPTPTATVSPSPTPSPSPPTSASPTPSPATTASPTPSPTPTISPSSSEPPPAQNTAPIVAAGEDQRLRLNSGRVEAVVEDDGLPSGQLSVRWSTVRAPAGGRAAFATPRAGWSDVTFSAPGRYVLQMTASDGQLVGQDRVAVEVNGIAVDVRVAGRRNDAEEGPGGRVRTNSASLQLGKGRRGDHVVGVRFGSVQVPKGATIRRAWLQFQTADASRGSAALTVAAQAASDAPRFSTTTRSISRRAVTKTVVGWEPLPWYHAGTHGPRQRTPNLSAVVQQVIDRRGWDPGNALVLILQGSGTRAAESFDGNSSAAPLLHIEYR